MRCICHSMCSSCMVYDCTYHTRHRCATRQDAQRCTRPLDCSVLSTHLPNWPRAGNAHEAIWTPWLVAHGPRNVHPQTWETLARCPSAGQLSSLNPALPQSARMTLCMFHPYSHRPVPSRSGGNCCSPLLSGHWQCPGTPARFCCITGSKLVSASHTLEGCTQRTRPTLPPHHFTLDCFSTQQAGPCCSTDPRHCNTALPKLLIVHSAAQT